MKKTIKIFGLRRSGTNYLAKLLENNLNCDVLKQAGKSKHDYPDIITNERIRNWTTSIKNPFGKEHFQDGNQLKRVLDSEIKTIVIIKPLFSWLSSYLKYSIVNQNNQTEPQVKLLDLKDRKTLTYLVKKWINYNLISQDYCVVVYDNLIKDPIQEIKRISKELGIGMKKDFKDEKNILMAGYHVSDTKFDKEYYLNKKYMDLFDKSDIKFINSLKP